MSLIMCDEDSYYYVGEFKLAYHTFIFRRKEDY